MSNWFECKVKYEKIDEQTGKEKKISEPYLVDAMSFTEAEARIYEKIGEFVHSEFIVTNIGKANYTEIFPFDDCDNWYKCKVTFITIDEKAGKEKKVSTQMLVMGNTVKHAFENLTESLTTGSFEFDIASVSLSPIVDIYPFNEDEEKIKGKKLLRTTQYTQKDDDQILNELEPQDVDEDESSEDLNEEQDSE